VKANAIPVARRTVFAAWPEWRSAWNGMFFTDEQQEPARRWTITGIETPRTRRSGAGQEIVHAEDKGSPAVTV
jgi:malate synthase